MNRIDNRIPSLDGWRAVSIVLVLMSHSERTNGFPSEIQSFTRWLPNGGFGVEVFFVISGFLITHLMLAERLNHGKVSLSRFYLRRALRILPAYTAFLLSLLALTFFARFELHWGQWARLLTFTSNFTWDSVAGNNPWPIGHTWTLSTEEQFYLLWPVCFVAMIGHARSPRKLLITCLIPVIFCPIARVINYLDLGGVAFSDYSFLVRADSLSWGCLLAILTTYRTKFFDRILRNHPISIAVLGIACIAIPLVLTRLLILGFVTVPLEQTLNGVGISILILLSISYSTAAPFRPLNSPLAVRLGAWSYSIYLWQQLFSSPAYFYGFLLPQWFLSFPVWIIPAIACGALSYYLIESPFLRLKKHLKSANRPPVDVSDQQFGSNLSFRDPADGNQT